MILFTLSGHGHFDMTSYEKYFAGQLANYVLPEAEIEKALQELPKVDL